MEKAPRLFEPVPVRVEDRLARQGLRKHLREAEGFCQREGDLQPIRCGLVLPVQNEEPSQLLGDLGDNLIGLLALERCKCRLEACDCRGRMTITDTDV